MKKTENILNAENNILIALFMGMQATEYGWFDNDNFLPEYVYVNEGGNTHDDLRFNDSWDWLMPAVSKCYDNIDPVSLFHADNTNFFSYPCVVVFDETLLSIIDGWSELSDGKGTNVVGDITHHLLDVDINETYKAVVEFIKWYNENKED